MDFTGERMVPGRAPLMLEMAHRARYLFAQDLCEGKTVLDFGCGAGYGSIMLARSAARVLGVDISAEAVRYAKGHYRASNLAYENCDIDSLASRADRYNAVVCFEVIEHLDNPDSFLKKLASVLEEPGLLVISTPNGKDEQNPYHQHGWDFDGFRRLLSSYFKDIRMYGQSASAEVGNFREEESLALQRAGDQANRLKRKNPWAKLVPGPARRWLYSVMVGRGLPREKQWKTEDFPIIEGKQDGEIIMAVCHVK